eukprot:1663410-Pyramimonas_sp.AAC.1
MEILWAMPADSPGAQFRLHSPLGKVPTGVCPPRHWEQDIRKRGFALDRFAWAECMAAAEAVWGGSAKARTDLVRRQSCALAVSVTLINEQTPCPLLDKYRLRNAFPPRRGAAAAAPGVAKR